MSQPFCLDCMGTIQVEGDLFTCTNPRCGQLSIAVQSNGIRARLVTRSSKLNKRSTEPEPVPQRGRRANRND